MNKKFLYTLSTAFLLANLAACNTDEGAMEYDYNDAARPIGYYSNENLDEKNGNAYVPERDNDGPITEMLDRTDASDQTNAQNVDNKNNINHNKSTLGTTDDGYIDGKSRLSNDYQNLTNDRGAYGQYSNRNSLADYGNNIGINNPTRPYSNQDQGLLRDNQFSGNDYNYHGQRATRNNIERSSYFNNYNGRLAQKIANRVEKIDNVDDVRAIVSGDNVLIAIDTNDRNDKTVQTQVKNAIRTLTNGKDVRIVTDEATYTRARNIDNDLRNGGPTDELDADVRDMFRELKDEVNDAVESPFRNTH